MEHPSDTRQVYEEYGDIKICKTSHGFSIIKNETLIQDGFVSAEFVPRKRYVSDNEYKFIVCKDVVYDSDLDKRVVIWMLFDLDGNRLFGDLKCKSISLPNIGTFCENGQYGKLYCRVYGIDIFIVEHEDSNYSLLLSDGMILFNSFVPFNALQVGDKIIISYLSDSKDFKSKRIYGIVDIKGNMIVPLLYSSIKPIH